MARAGMLPAGTCQAVSSLAEPARWSVSARERTRVVVRTFVVAVISWAALIAACGSTSPPNEGLSELRDATVASPPDAAGFEDALAPLDDASAPADAGLPSDAETPSDAGVSSDATVAPDAADPAVPEIRARIQAVFLSDDDGGRAVAMTPAQVVRWIEYANGVFAAAHVVFDFDPVTDVTELRSTILNSAEGAHQPEWFDILRAGDEVAALNPSSITILFRYGADIQPTGSGFSWTNYHFVGAPGFDATVVCDRQNIELLAHELGHQLGLAHTFSQVFASLPAAEAVAFNGGAAFDGDGLDDTPPDPMIDAPEYQCDNIPEIILAGSNYPLPRDNVMGYYAHPAKTLTPEQQAIVRQGVLLRTGQPLSLAYETQMATSVIEGEASSAVVSGGLLGVQEMNIFLGRWSGGAQLFWYDAQPGMELEIALQALSEADYEVYFTATRAPDYAIAQYFMDGQPLGAPVDLYGRTVRPTGVVYLGRVHLTAGPHVLSLQLTGKNPRNITNYYFYGIDALLFAIR